MRHQHATVYTFTILLLVSALPAIAQQAEEDKQLSPTGGCTFNSELAMAVYVVKENNWDDTVGNQIEDELIGQTPSETPLSIPECLYWYVSPAPSISLDMVCDEVEGQGIPGLSLLAATDDDIAELIGLIDLRTLILRDSLVTDAGVASLWAMEELRVLDLAGADITDAGLDSISELTELRSLYLGGTRSREGWIVHASITGVGLEHLAGLPKLETLDLGYTAITDSGLGALAEFPELRTLYLTRVDITDEGLAHLAGMTQLRNCRH